MRDIGRTIKMLSKMTVRNGCTDAEAEAASKKLLDLAARRRMRRNSVRRSVRSAGSGAQGSLALLFECSPRGWRTS
jgi:hypothetical protein